MYRVGGWAFSALAQWRLLGSLHRGAALCLAVDAEAFLGSTCQAPAASPAPAGTHWVTSVPVPLTRAHDSRQQATPKANARRASSPVALSRCDQVENTVPPSRSQVTLLARTCQDKGTSPMFWKCLGTVALQGSHHHRALGTGLVVSPGKHLAAKKGPYPNYRCF